MERTMGIDEFGICVVRQRGGEEAGGDGHVYAESRWRVAMDRQQLTAYVMEGVMMHVRVGQ